MTDLPREELNVGAPHQAWTEHGLIELRYVGTVEASTTRAVSDRVLSAAYPISVYLIDLSRLDGFTPEARKVFSSMKIPAGMPNVDKLDLYFYLVGATIKTKAIFALVLAASRLLGPIRFHSVYRDDLDAARAEARAKRDELVAAGVLPPPPGRV